MPTLNCLPFRILLSAMNTIRKPPGFSARNWRNGITQIMTMRRPSHDRNSAVRKPSGVLSWIQNWQNVSNARFATADWDDVQVYTNNELFDSKFARALPSLPIVIFRTLECRKRQRKMRMTPHYRKVNICLYCQAIIRRIMRIPHCIAWKHYPALYSAKTATSLSCGWQWTDTWRAAKSTSFLAKAGWFNCKIYS